MVPAGLRGRGFAHAVTVAGRRRGCGGTFGGHFWPRIWKFFLRWLPVVRGQQAVDSSGKGGILAKRGANAPVGDRLDGLSVGPNEDGTGQ